MRNDKFWSGVWNPFSANALPPSKETYTAIRPSLIHSDVNILPMAPLVTTLQKRALDQVRRNGGVVTSRTDGLSQMNMSHYWPWIIPVVVLVMALFLVSLAYVSFHSIPLARIMLICHTSGGSSAAEADGVLGDPPLSLSPHHPGL